MRSQLAFRLCAASDCEETIPPTKRSDARFCSEKCRDRTHCRRWRAENPDKARESYQRYRESNPEKVRETTRLWKDENPEKVRELNQRRRALKAEATVETFTDLEVFERDNWTCGICREPIDQNLRHPDPMSVSLDHIVPLSKGGEHSRANTQAAHLRCNQSKGATLEEDLVAA